MQSSRRESKVGEGGRDVLDDVSEDSDCDEVEGQAVYCIQGSEEQDLDLCVCAGGVSDGRRDG